MSGKGSWIGIALIAAILALLVFELLLKVGGHGSEIASVAAFFATLAYGLSR
jgi:hypothetical protein